jgi:hypothetical protein
MNKNQCLCFLTFLALILVPVLSFYISNSYSIEEQMTGISAESLYNTEFMSLQSNIGSLIILIPNEAHESWTDERHKLLSVKNPYFLPSKTSIPNGTNIVFLNADAPWDTPHPHTIEMERSGEMIYSTGKMDYGESSQPITLSIGNYSILDPDYNWMKGTITVREENSNGNQVVGAFYVPTNEVANNKDNDGKMHPGSLDYYRKEFANNGFTILSEHNFSYKACNYCEGSYWPDNKTGEHTLVIFSTDQPLDEAVKILQKLATENVYV